MNLPGVADPAHDDRRKVDLIFFPTGGGKTEAYLGLIAFALTLRRLRGVARPDQGLGVAILLRYTLRLLMLDQLGRAATLICALELIRREGPEKLSGERFSIGLWVGRSATANTMEQVSDALTLYRSKRGPLAVPAAAVPVVPEGAGPELLRDPAQRDGARRLREPRLRPTPPRHGHDSGSEIRGRHGCSSQPINSRIRSSHVRLVRPP